MPFRQLTDEQLAQAEKMLADGATMRATSEATGVSVTTLYKRFKPQKDPTPGGKRQQTKRAKVGPTDEQLTNVMTKVAVAPAIPMGLWVQCDFCATHFVNTGPTAAAKLVEMSHDHPALRSLLEKLWGTADEIAWAGVLAMWLGVPIAHHAAPDFIYRWLQAPLNMPPRGVAQPHAHAHNGNGAVPPTPGPEPFAEMDLETLLRTAQDMGIDVNVSNDAVTDPTAETESSDETVTAVASDSDTGE